VNPIDNNLKIGLEKSELLPQQIGGGPRPAGDLSEASFQDVLKGLVDKVDSLQKDADASIKGLVTGETTDLHDVSMKLQEAGVAFELMMEIRNKLLDAYQEIIKMQP
jgi:flagellar hook-basal body complex protein FliE